MNLDTHMDNGLKYRVYQNQGQGSITHGVMFLWVLQFAVYEKFHHTSLENCEGDKVDILCAHGCGIVHIGIRAKGP